jgi:phage terminase large subunit-like protein
LTDPKLTRQRATKSGTSSKRSIQTSNPDPTSYSERAHQYARDVVAGKVVACKWVRLACQRHLDDLERSKTAAFRYKFIASKADKKCKIIERLPHIKGKWAKQRLKLKLENFQCFAVCSLFGWVSKENLNYRFTEAYLCLPRKNAKSTLAAAIGHIKFVADEEHGAEVYSGATSEKQAWEVFGPARLMAKNTPSFLEHYGVEVNAKSLTVPAIASKFEPIIGKPGDGASPSCAIVDEYHEHPDDTLYDTMKTGMVARENALLLVITTAGSNRSSPCYALQLDAQKVLEGKVQNDNLFALIYTIDEGDDWKTEDALRKANPNYNVSVIPERVLATQRDAIQNARKQNIFKTKHLNVWVNAAVGWMNMAALEKCSDPSLRIEDFLGRECIEALDLANVSDIASKAQVFWEDREEADKEGKTKTRRHYFYFGSNYLNETKSEENQTYQGWAEDGYLIVTPGNSTDYGWIAEEVLEDSKKFNIRQVAHDPWQAPPLIQAIQANSEWDQSIDMVEIRATVENFSAPMKEVEAAILDGRFHYNGDPVFEWAMSNVVCHTDKKDNIYPRKERDENKIDPAVALIMAVNRAMTAAVDTGEIFTAF